LITAVTTPGESLRLMAGHPRTRGSWQPVRRLWLRGRRLEGRPCGCQYSKPYSKVESRPSPSNPAAQAQPWGGTYAGPHPIRSIPSTGRSRNMRPSSTTAAITHRTILSFRFISITAGTFSPACLLPSSVGVLAGRRQGHTSRQRSSDGRLPTGARVPVRCGTTRRTGREHAAARAARGGSPARAG
jgi:hypothetical protein